jgi:hypothetical protein
MTHSDLAYLVAVIVFIIAAVIAVSEKGWYAALIAVGLTAVALGLLVT